MTEYHVLERDSPKGELFIGTCIRCGRTGLRLADAATRTCSNPSGMSIAEAVVKAVEGSKENELDNCTRYWPKH